MKDKPVYPSKESVETKIPSVTKGIGTIHTNFIYHKGITLREHYAGLAMQGLLAQSKPLSDTDWYTRMSVKMADALIKELKK